MIGERIFRGVVELDECASKVGGKLVFASGFPRIRPQALDEEPIELVLADQSAAGFCEREGIAESLTGALIGTARNPASPVCTARVLTAKIEHVAVFKRELAAFVEELGFFLA